MALFRNYLYKFINFNIIFTYLVTLYFCVHVVVVVGIPCQVTAQIDQSNL